MFRHLNLSSGNLLNKGKKGVLVFTSVSRLPEVDTPVPRHAGVDTYHELHFVICILL